MYEASTSNSNLYQFLGVTELAVSLEMVEEMIRMPSNLQFIDPMCSELNVLKEFDADHRIMYRLFQMPTFVSNRDFVWFATNRRITDTIFVSAGRSVAVKEYGVKDGLVRGEIRASGFVIESIDAGRRCRMSYLVQVDAGGWIPSTLINFVSREQAYKPGIIKDKLPEFKQLWNQRHPERKID